MASSSLVISVLDIVSSRTVISMCSGSILNLQAHTMDDSSLDKNKIRGDGARSALWLYLGVAR